MSEHAEARFRRLFDRIGEWVTDGRVSIVPFTHWLSDVWIDRTTGVVWIKLLQTRERKLKRKATDQESKDWPYVRMQAQEFERRYKFIKAPTALLEKLISGG